MEPQIRKKSIHGLTQQEALDLFRSDDLVGIGMVMEVRRKKTDP